MDDIRAAAVSVVLDAFVENENKIVALLNKLQDEAAQEHRRRKRYVLTSVGLVAHGRVWQRYKEASLTQRLEN